MSWWWPFGKKRARDAERAFREMLDEAMLRHGDLEAATAQLAESRKKRKTESEKAAVELTRARTRNA